MSRKREMLSMSEIRELRNDAEWALDGKSRGYCPAEDVLALCDTIEIMCDTIELVYRELVTLD